jgi:hypothetical protein
MKRAREERVEAKDKKTLITTNIQRVVFSGESMANCEFKSKKSLRVNDRNNNSMAIDEKSEFRVSKRSTDPNNPKYFYYNIEGKPEVLEPIEKSTPKILHKSLKKQSFGLNTCDIEGAQSRKLKAFKNDKRLNNEKVVRSELRRGIKTSSRRVNPVDPIYNLPLSYTDSIYEVKKYSNNDEITIKKKTKFDLKEQSFNILNNLNKIDGKPALYPFSVRKFSCVKNKENDIFCIKVGEIDERSKKKQMNTLKDTSELLTAQTKGIALIYPTDVSDRQEFFFWNYFKNKRKMENEKVKKMKANDGRDNLQIKENVIMDLDNIPKNESKVVRKYATNHEAFEHYIDWKE